MGASPPRRIRRWLVVGAVLVTVLLALVGLASVTRGTPVERVRWVGERVTFPPPADPRFARTMELYTGAPLSEGNTVEVLTNGDETYPRLWADLAGATRSLTVQLYFTQPGAMADTMARILSGRARHGVRVLLLLDAFGSQNLSDAWLDSLRMAGVRVALLRTLRWYKLNRLTSRSHVRAIVVDGVVGYTGGFGLAEYWQGDGRTHGEWRETNVRFRGPAVAQLQAAFLTSWAEATGTLLGGELFYPPAALLPAGHVRGALVHTSPTKGSTSAERFLALSMVGASRTLYVTNSYFLPDDDFRRFLCAQARRGVDVRVLTAGERTDIESVYYASRYRYAELLRCGVRLYEYQPAMVHAKTFVVDGVWSAIGSMNFDNRSLALNDEAMLVALDARVGMVMTSLFLSDLRYSHEITLGEFAERPRWERILEAGAALLSRVL